MKLGRQSATIFSATCSGGGSVIGSSPGITAARIPEVLAAGAHGVAVLSEVLLSDDPAAAARRCRGAIDAHDAAIDAARKAQR